MESILECSGGQHLSYRHNHGKKDLTLVFMHGTMSDKNTDKSLFLEKLCKEQDISYIAFDFAGHGKSSGKYTDGTIGGWMQNAADIIERTTQGPVVLAGSSMGGWVSLLAAQAMPGRVKAVVGLAAAADFTKTLWDKFSPEQKKEMQENGITYTPNGRTAQGDPWTKKLFQEAQSRFILNGKDTLNITCPVLLIQGAKDTCVPPRTAYDIADAAKSKNTRVVILENGGHRLSGPEELNVIGTELKSLLAELESREIKTAGRSASAQKILNNRQKHRRNTAAAKKLKAERSSLR